MYGYICVNRDVWTYGFSDYEYFIFYSIFSYNQPRLIKIFIVKTFQK